MNKIRFQTVDFQLTKVIYEQQLANRLWYNLDSQFEQLIIFDFIAGLELVIITNHQIRYFNQSQLHYAELANQLAAIYQIHYDNLHAEPVDQLYIITKDES